MLRAALVAAIALVAGCASPPSPPGATPTAASPTPRAENATPFEDVELSHDFSEGSGAASFEIPDGAGELRLRVWQDARDASACATVDARVTVSTPSGETFAEASPDGRGVVLMPAGPCVEGEEVVGELAPGTWTVAFEGQGLTIGRVSIVPT